MDHQICLNTNSFPAQSAEQAYTLFEDALQGILQLNNGNDRFTLYLDHDVLLADFLLADEYCYEDFMEQLLTSGEHDIYAFLTELEDKSPALDFLNDEIIEEVSEYSFYMPNYSIPKNGEIFSLAYFLSATLLSIKTAEQWHAQQVSIARTENDGRFIDETLTLNNIACVEHGRFHLAAFKHIDIKAICEYCVLSDEFIAWYNSLTSNNQHKVIDKYRLACERKFAGGEPLFKTLTNGNGMREIRFSAYEGGAIRILFKALTQGKQAILLGFIKKSDNEGYIENIPKACKLFEQLITL